MNNLPQEITDRISSYLNHDDLKNTLLISRKWQYAAEQYSQAFSDFTLTTNNDSKFLSTYHGRRFRYLQNVTFETSLPDLGPDDDAEDDCRETANELECIDQHFTRQIYFLFSTLKTVETCLGNVFDTRLGSVNGSRKIHLTIYTPTREIIDREYCLHRYFVSWRVHLLSPSTLPSLLSVRSLTMHGWEVSFANDDTGLRKLDHRVLLDIASKLPNLNFLQCRLGADEWTGSFKSKELSYITHDWEGPRRDSRHDFSKAYKAAALPSLRHVQLDFLYPLQAVENFDQQKALPNLTKPAIYDPFSSSLRILSYQLRTMNLRVVADKSLFWPTDGSIPSWPNLESINVMFHISTPSGSWYFCGLPGVGATKGFDVTNDAYPPLATMDRDPNDDSQVADLDWDYEYYRSQFRVEPNEETLVPLLTAFAKAATLMPSLKEFALWSPLQFNPPDLDIYENFDAKKVSNFTDLDLAWGVAYTKPYEKAFMTFPGKDFSSNRQIWWKVAKWRPDPELHSLFQNIGFGKHGKDMIEYWGANDSGEGLNLREWFLDWERERWIIST